MGSQYALLSLPLGVFDSGDKDEAISALRATVSNDNGTVVPFKIPDFKIGTLDALVQQADDLTKLEAACEGVVTKVAESLRTVLDGDEERLSQYKMVNDSQRPEPVECHRTRADTVMTEPTDHYVSNFSWNKIRYRADKPLGEIVDTLQKVWFDSF